MSKQIKLRPLSLPHKAMTEKSGEAQKCAIRMLQEYSRDYDVLREFVERYIEFQNAADIVSGQLQPPPREKDAA